MFLISGLDITIVGHYQYKDAGFYAVAAGAANFMMAIVSSFFGPLIPAISSMQAGSTPSHLGNLCIRATRYCTLLLCLLGLPLVVGAFPLLSLWVGNSYATHSALYLQIMVMGNVIRYLSMPYLAAVIATSRQRQATAATVVEACVNIVLSIWLVQKIGAVGVAIGTLVASFISMGVHLTVSIPHTQSAITFQRRRYVLQGLLRSFLVVDSCTAPLSFLEKGQYASGAAGPFGNLDPGHSRHCLVGCIDGCRSKGDGDDPAPAHQPPRLDAHAGIHSSGGGSLPALPR